MKVYCLIYYPFIGSGNVIDIFTDKKVALHKLERIKFNNFKYLFKEESDKITLYSNDVYEIQELNLNIKETNE